MCGLLDIATEPFGNRPSL